jgi:hypothetical protein
VERLQYPSEFQVGEGIVGQHKPLWAKGESVDTEDENLLQVEIVGRSQLALWLPKPSSLNPLVALMALLHRRGFVATALRRPDSWPVRVDRLPAAVESYYRRGQHYPEPFVFGHLEMQNDEHWDPGSLDYPKLFGMVRDVIDGGEEKDVAELTENQKEGIEFANGMRRFLEGGDEPSDPGSLRRGFRFAQRHEDHVGEAEPEPNEAPIPPITFSGYSEKHPGPEEEEEAQP